jgi:hypothetical protein
VKRPFIVAEIVGDRHTPPDGDWAKMVCLVGQGALCCRYLCAGVNGLSCEKHGPLREQIDARAAADKMCAISDNCTGRLSI